jgi:hypothetical protein
MASNITKWCSGCKLDLSRESFNRSRNSRDGLQTACKQCRKKWDREYRAKVGSEHFTMAHRRRKWGITQEQYSAKLTKQKNACEICTEPFDETPHVDHDHTTGILRGLLCSQCNLILGGTRDRPWVAQAMADYLKKYSQVPDTHLTPPVSNSWASTA